MLLALKVQLALIILEKEMKGNVKASETGIAFALHHTVMMCCKLH